MLTTLTAGPAATTTAFLDAFAEHDVAAAVALADPQVALVVPPLGVRAGDRAALQIVLTELTTAFPDLLLTVRRVIVTGDVVTALFTIEGTQAAAYAGVVNQEKHVDLSHAWRFVIEDGVITAVSAYWCQQQLYRRLAVKRFDQVAIVGGEQS
jgi:steroid delta-isomerase-like uncharacterized protein